MQFSLTTLLLSVTVVCIVLGFVLYADRVPAGAVSNIGLPVGIGLAVLTAIWRKARWPKKLAIAGLFSLGWCGLLVLAELVLAALRDFSDDRFVLMLTLALLAVPTSLVSTLLLQAWLWSWHERFGRD